MMTSTENKKVLKSILISTVLTLSVLVPRNEPIYNWTNTNHIFTDLEEVKIEESVVMPSTLDIFNFIVMAQK